MPQKKTKVIREIPENPFIQGQAKRKKLRVAAYCRVSTEQEEQESSFENQVAYYTDLIQSNPEWEFAGIFADRGISGADMRKRDAFIRMLNACRQAGMRVWGGENAPYVWVQCPDGLDSWQMFDKMLYEANVVITPGSGFGSRGEGFFRISAFNSRENVDEVCRRIHALFAR